MGADESLFAFLLRYSGCGSTPLIQPSLATRQLGEAPPCGSHSRAAFQTELPFSLVHHSSEGVVFAHMRPPKLLGQRQNPVRRSFFRRRSLPRYPDKALASFDNDSSFRTAHSISMTSETNVQYSSIRTLAVVIEMSIQFAWASLRSI